MGSLLLSHSHDINIYYGGRRGQGRYNRPILTSCSEDWRGLRSVSLLYHWTVIQYIQPPTYQTTQTSDQATERQQKHNIPLNITDIIYIQFYRLLCISVQSDCRASCSLADKIRNVSHATNSAITRIVKTLYLIYIYIHTHITHKRPGDIATYTYIYSFAFVTCYNLKRYHHIS